MARDTIDIGPVPSDEKCAQVGEEGYELRAKDECNRFISLIRKVIGVEPDGARLRVKGYPHDFGRYYEVVVDYDPDDKAAVEYALRVEDDAPTQWVDRDAMIAELKGEVARLETENRRLEALVRPTLGTWVDQDFPLPPNKE